MSGRDDAELLNRAAVLRHVLARQASPAAIAASPAAVINTVLGQPGLALRIDAQDGQLLASTASSAPSAASPRVPAVRMPVGKDIRDGSAGSSRVLAMLARTADAGVVRVTLSRQRSDRLAILRRYVPDLLAALLAGTLVATGLGYWAVRRGLAPLRLVIGKADEISTNRLRGRLQVDEVPAELRQLGQAFNAMLDRLEEGVQRLSGFAADLAHDLRTPINTLLVETQVMLSRPRTPEQYEAALASNTEEYERIGRMIENTLFLARADSAQLAVRPERLDLARELGRIVDYFEGVAEEAGVAVALRHTEMLPTLEADPILFQRAVSNLVSNAIRHSRAGSTVVIGTGSGAGAALVTVTNDGDGIAADKLHLVFERYYRSDPSRTGVPDGAGLGLAIVRAIMHLHGGEAGVHSSDGHTRFELRFPAPLVLKASLH
ncbi:two-component system heavy metal sensor histidine kinase CusS [Pseudoduganella lurida]|uniref:Sensor protein n=2 Tax=Pseudoduganella lurida TaxID=1036180 RepID=A0A562QUG8_9BURK|nr:two-component system heavy metal sensor histidine kinase CusS [Pseudoduganella lurida]